VSKVETLLRLSSIVQTHLQCSHVRDQSLLYETAESAANFQHLNTGNRLINNNNNDNNKNNNMTIY